MSTNWTYFEVKYYDYNINVFAEGFTLCKDFQTTDFIINQETNGVLTCMDGLWPYNIRQIKEEEKKRIDIDKIIADLLGIDYIISIPRVITQKICPPRCVYFVAM